MKTIKTISFVTIVTSILFSISNYGQESVTNTVPVVRPQVRRSGRIISPEILPDNRVTFRVYSNDAKNVTVTGDGLAGFVGTEALARNDTGMFSLTVGPLRPELYGYTFTIDGVRTIDPNNVQVRRDGVNYQSFFIVPGVESDLYIHKHNVAHGTVSKVWYHSNILQMDRRVYIYTPPGYEGGKQKYPVFYLLHGAGGDEDAWTNMGRAAQIIDNLLSQGKAKPMIVVMTNGNANQGGAQNDVPSIQAQGNQGTAGSRPATGNFETHLVKDLEPFVVKYYRTLKGMDNRAIAGLSMGGRHTQTITYDNPGMFGYIGVFSMGITNTGRQDQNTAKIEQDRDAKIEALKNSGYKLYWIACGKDDRFYPGVTTLRNTLDKHNFKYIYRESTGAHYWDNWRIYLSEFAQMIFK